MRSAVGLRPSPRPPLVASGSEAGAGAVARRGRCPEDGTVTKESWDQFSWKEQVASQHPDLAGGDLLSSALFPFDAIRPGVDTDEWLACKVDAAKVALKAVMPKTSSVPRRRRNPYASSDSDDDEGSYSSEDEVNENALKNFFGALPYNAIFLMGFDVLGTSVDDEANCFCPCGRKMAKWRTQFKVGGTIEHSSDACDEGGAPTKKMGPAALLDHLDKIGGGAGAALHRGVAKYIRELYRRHCGGNGHKALHKMGDKCYKKAVAYERREDIRARQKLERELVQERQKRKGLEEKERQKELEMLAMEKVNKEMYNKIRRLEEDKKALGVEASKKVELTDQDLLRYRSLCRAMFRSLRDAITATKQGQHQPATLRVKQSFDLNETFEDWYNVCRRKQSGDKTFLFRSVGTEKTRGQHVGRVLGDWDVQYETVTSARKNKDDETKAIDQGGPSREFMSQVWRQMSELVIKLPIDRDEADINIVEGVEVRTFEEIGRVVKVEHKGLEVITFDVKFSGGRNVVEGIQRDNLEVVAVPINLFESHSGYIVPVKDEKLESAFKAYAERSNMTEDEFFNCAKAFYRAIGRIMLHCMATNHAISSAALPTFFRNILFRGCGPDDSAYDHSDLMDHAVEIGFSQSAKEHFLGHTFDDVLGNGSMEVVTSKSFFDVCLKELLVDSRKVALHALREGLTCDGMVPITDIFAVMPIEAVGKSCFSNLTITAEDVIACLKPQYVEEVHDESGRIVPIDEVLRNAQRHFFEKTLPNTLRDRECIEKADEAGHTQLVEERRDFLSAFVSFCSGYSFLPHRGADFAITVLFDISESVPESLPSAHTCDNMLKIPVWSYGNDAEQFSGMLDRSFQLTEGTFGMN